MVPFCSRFSCVRIDEWKPGEHNGTFVVNNLASLQQKWRLKLFGNRRCFEKEIKRKGEYNSINVHASHCEWFGWKQLFIVQKAEAWMRVINCLLGELAIRHEKCFQNGLWRNFRCDDQVVKFSLPLIIRWWRSWKAHWYFRASDSRSPVPKKTTCWSRKAYLMKTTTLRSVLFQVISRLLWRRFYWIIEWHK